MHLLMTVKRFHGGACLVTFLRTADGAHTKITTPVNFWAMKRRGLPRRTSRIGHGNVRALRELASRLA
jgi:hypothetical protein